MSTAILIAVTLALLHCCADAQSVANLKFDEEYASNSQTVWITCETSTVKERSDLSELKFYALDSNYTYILTRNCSTNGLTESDTGFDGSVVYWNGNRNQSLHLLWSNLTSDFNKLQFQCSISGCTSNESAVSNNASITVLPNPSQPKIEPQLPSMNSGKPSNVTLTCSGFVGYPGGNLELKIINYDGQENIETVQSLANFSADVEGNAHGSYVLATDGLLTHKAVCVAYNILNNAVPKSYAISDKFMYAFAPWEVFVVFGQNSYHQLLNKSIVINQTTPILYKNLQCAYYVTRPKSKVQLKLLSTEYESIFTKVSNDTYVMYYDGTDAFSLEFNCIVVYESMSEPNIREDWNLTFTMNVWSQSMGTTMIASVHLVLATMALLCNL